MNSEESNLNLEGLRNKAELSFYKEDATLLLTIPDMSQSCGDVRDIAMEANLSQKEEFHVTLIGTRTGKEIIEKDNGSKERLEAIEKLAREYEWTVNFKRDYYYISKKYNKETETGEEEERMSIIELVELPDIQSFYVRLNELLGTDFDIPFPHVTLYTTSSREDRKLRGIGVYSKEDFDLLKPRKLK